mmetsp:Transcript_18832/g.33629  ORF Transcript_18832/g.33629 Transcript_18832/m.33629 type:complete len:211 (-) Transcript_18832:358-990(-)
MFIAFCSLTLRKTRAWVRGATPTLPSSPLQTHTKLVMTNKDSQSCFSIVCPAFLTASTTSGGYPILSISSTLTPTRSSAIAASTISVCPPVTGRPKAMRTGAKSSASNSACKRITSLRPLFPSPAAPEGPPPSSPPSSSSSLSPASPDAKFATDSLNEDMQVDRMLLSATPLKVWMPGASGAKTRRRVFDSVRSSASRNAAAPAWSERQP